MMYPWDVMGAEPSATIAKWCAVCMYLCIPECDRQIISGYHVNLKPSAIVLSSAFLSAFVSRKMQAEGGKISAQWKISALLKGAVFSKLKVGGGE